MPPQNNFSEIAVDFFYIFFFFLCLLRFHMQSQNYFQQVLPSVSQSTPRTRGKKGYEEKKGMKIAKCAKNPRTFVVKKQSAPHRRAKVTARLSPVTQRAVTCFCATVVSGLFFTA